MGHAAYTRGSRAISAHIDQQSRSRRKPDAFALLEAECKREKSRAEKQEAKVAELEAELNKARRSLGILRGTLDVERESRRLEAEDLRFKLAFAAKALATRMP